jgi:hypothetical protein
MKLEPIFACTYGPSKIGKTTDFLYSFPQGLFVAQQGALKPCEWIGYTTAPRRVEVKNLIELVELIRNVKIPDSSKKPNSFPFILVDDLSLLADTTISQLERRLSGFKLWAAMRDCILDIRSAARSAGAHVLANAHESGRREFNGRVIRCGPKLPGSLPEDFPAACDMILRAAMGSDRQGLGYAGVYRLGIDVLPDSITGDRLRIAFDGCPMNLAELFRCAGFEVPRLPELDWAEPVVEKAAGLLLPLLKAADMAQIQSFKLAVFTQLANKYTSDLKLVRWVLRDIFDRAQIRLSQQRLILSEFGLNAADLNLSSRSVGMSPQ